jgi:hypothetical protein
VDGDLRITDRGALVSVTIGPPASMAATGLPVRPPVSVDEVVIDTGSGSTHVSAEIVTGLGLNPTGEYRGVRPFGKAMKANFPTCDVRITLAGASVEIPAMVGLVDQIRDDEELGPAPKIILGRDFLSHCDLAWNGPGGTFSISVPS